MTAELADKWIKAKRQEDIAKKLRLNIEAQILDSGVNLKSEGANHYQDKLVITTGFTRKWDQDGLATLELPRNSFVSEFKEVRKNTKALEEMSPEYWNDNFAPLLTLTPKKPAFKEKK